MKFADLTRALSSKGWTAFGAILSPPSRGFRISAADVEDRPAELFFRLKATLDALRDPEPETLAEYGEVLAVLKEDDAVASYVGLIEQTRRTTFRWARSLGAGPGKVGDDPPTFLVLSLHPEGGFATFKVRLYAPDLIALEVGHAIELDDPPRRVFWSKTWPRRALTDAELLTALEDARELVLASRSIDSYTVVERPVDPPANEGARRMARLIKTLTRREPG